MLEDLRPAARIARTPSMGSGPLSELIPARDWMFEVVQNDLVSALRYVIHSFPWCADFSMGGRDSTRAVRAVLGA